MDFAALITFCRTIEHGNMTSAASALNITKSVASRRLKALEDELGTTLLRRTTRGVAATDAGQDLYDRAVKILQELDEAKQAMQDKALTGRLRITAPRSFADIILKTPFSAFIADNPEIEMEMALSDSRTDILGGGFDVAFRIARSLDDSSLRARKLCDIRNVLVASPDYLTRFGEPTCPEELSKHRAIRYSYLSLSQTWVFTDENGEVSDRTNIRVAGSLSTNSGDMQSELVRQGLGLVVIPRFFVAQDLAEGRLVELMTDTPPVSSHLYALMPDVAHRPARVRALVDLVEQFVRSPEQRAIL